MKKLLITIITICSFYGTKAQTEITYILDGSLSKGYTSSYWRQVSGRSSQINAPDSIKCQVSGLTEGQYEYELSVKNSCCERKDSVMITVITGTLSVPGKTKKTNTHRPLKEKFNTLQFRVIQVSGYLKVQLTSPRIGSVFFSMYDIVGRKLEHRELKTLEGENNYTIPLSHYATGIYLIRFNNYFDESSTQKIYIP